MKKSRRKNPTKRKNPIRRRRKNPSTACPSCGAGNSAGRADCWKCHFELKGGAKPHFGRSMRAPKRRAKRKTRRHLKRNKRSNRKR